MNVSDSIVAQCTPSGSGALAVIRLSGFDACALVSQISRLSSKITIEAVATHTIHHGYVIDKDNNEIDEVLFFVMHGPRTFTGEDVVEISCHNNQFIIESIIAAALSVGARLAQPGEFARRAVCNNKMDVIKAESINELIHAGNQQAVKHSLAQVKGSLSAEIAKIETVMVKALALSEASFEFIDEEDMHFGADITRMFSGLCDTMSVLKKAYDMRQHIKDGMRVVLVGSVNAGKSSLFNMLLRKERAIVTSIAGTTRDVIEAGVYRDGMQITVVDTAGLRETDNCIEQKGIEKSHQEAQKADCVLLVVDPSHIHSLQEQDAYNNLYATYKHKTIVVATKNDLPSVQTYSFLKEAHAVSVHDAQSVVLLEQELCKALATSVFGVPFLINKRHMTLIMSFEAELALCLRLLKANDVSYEILSHHIKQALSYLSELTGKTISEAAMDAVFREFCVGK